MTLTMGTSGSTVTQTTLPLFQGTSRNVRFQLLMEMIYIFFSDSDEDMKKDDVGDDSPTLPFR